MIPYREFDGEPGDYSVDTAGPVYLQKDLDKLFKMFNPQATHADGTSGGIGTENLNFSTSIGAYVQQWMDEHPEATTTVPDHSLTIDKMVVGTLGYVTPEMFGAIGDGAIDDTEAIQAALNSGSTVFFAKKTYCISETLIISGSVDFGNATIKAADEMSVMISCTNLGDILRLSGGTIDCNQMAETGISLMGCYGAYVQNMKVLDATSESIYISESATSRGGHNWVIACKLYNKNTCASGVVNDTPDLKIINTEIYYTSCAVEHKYGIIFLANTHLWSGGVANADTDSIGIKADGQTNPRVFGTNLYLDSFYIGVDLNARVGKVHLTNSLFYWAETTPHSTSPFTCYGIRCGKSTKLSLDSCFYQTFSPITKVDILYGTTPIDYSEPKQEVTSMFSVTENVTATVFKATVMDKMLYIDFALEFVEVTADDTTWYPVLVTDENPKVHLFLSRMDFAGYNETQEKSVVCRVGPWTDNDVIKVHIKGDISIGDVVYGGVAVPVV